MVDFIWGDKMDYTKNGSITADGRTIDLKPFEKHQINVRFNNMDICPLSYELTTTNGGNITIDGLYTAPGRSGSYEIRITCTNYPQIGTYAYVSVGE